MDKRIIVVANGRNTQATLGQKLPDFLNELGLAPDRVVVERNRAALTPSEARDIELEEGDVLEIVQIIAGG